MSNKFFTKILLAFGLLACAATAAYAVRAYPYPITVTQPDGTTLTIQIHGDEFLNWTTAGGRLVEKGQDGFYYLASFNSDGTKSLSKTRVSSNSLASFASSGNTVRPPQAAIAAAKIKRQSIARIGNPDLATGEHRFLVMLIEFADLEFTIDNPNEQFRRLLNEEGYSDNGGTGSSYDYYYQNSGGRFDPTFDIVGPIKVSGNHAEYGNDRGSTAASRLLAEACRLADSQIDFSIYDQDGNGTVDNIFFYFAGHNAAEGGGDDCIWPHQWQLYTQHVGTITCDGVSLNTSYACTSEYRGTGSTMAGIGTFTHEFGHVIGLPDFYDADYEENGNAAGPGTLSLMASGSYNNNGCTPPYLSGFERSMLGWLDLTEWEESGTKTLKPVHENEAYTTPTATDGEFYVYEYRDGTGWDQYVGGTGVAIYHVDRSAQYLSRWERNEVNNYENHECYDLIESSGNKWASYNSDKLYPGSTNNREFSSTSTPAAEDWKGNPTGFNLTNITDNGSNATLMLINLSGGTVIDEFIDFGVNAIDRDDTYSAGDTFEFALTVSNMTPVQTVWYFDGQEQDITTNPTIVLTAGEHTVQAIATYSDKSTETITTKLNVQ